VDFFFRTITTITPLFIFLGNGGVKLAGQVIDLTAKVSKFAEPVIHACSGVSQVKNGTMAAKKLSNERQYEEISARRVQEIVRKTPHLQCKMAYGFFYGGACISGTLLALHQHSKVNLHKTLPFVTRSCNELFFFAALVGIYHHSIQLEEAICHFKEVQTLISSLDRADSFIAKEYAEKAALDLVRTRERVLSAAIGLVSNIYAALMRFVLFFGAPGALLIVFGAISSVTGFAKVLYDFWIEFEEEANFKLPENWIELKVFPPSSPLPGTAIRV
jgi:hypothetical protein